MIDEQAATPQEPLRPRDLALLLLASGDVRPRQRARDQQADSVGLDIKRRVLLQLADLDPDPEQIDAALQRVVDELGPPTGPTRAIAATVRDEWQAACQAPEWVAQLLGEAMLHSNDKPHARRHHD